MFTKCGAIAIGELAYPKLDMNKGRDFMAKTEMIRARVEPGVKQDAEAVFSTLGLSPTEAITLFYKQVALQHGLPFEVRVPNAETLEAMRQAKDKNSLQRYESLDDLMAEFDDA